MSYGSLAAIPIDNGLVWVRPFYVTSTQTDLPSLRFVIVNYEGTVSIQPTLLEALADVFDEDAARPGEPPPDPGEEPTEPEGTVDEQVAALLDGGRRPLRRGRRRPCATATSASYEELSDDGPPSSSTQAERALRVGRRAARSPRRPRPPPRGPRPSGQAVAAQSPGSPSRSTGVVSSESLRSMIVSASVRARR